ncbi:membrane protein insertion efficiency factor YidD [Kocuria coralli]|uniref:Putative membrane protein insertion efficiency factor n=1 Tax=Kocuria coralli TaxID=1461025 RepID=A0A5J5KZL9_9MICC|nr:membrane protein insertion efficiency factor YidD [Kocuria coralli]KAA9394790.1 membrane protein insertion efficiency factor YidD [Kocuria coralli]
MSHALHEDHPAAGAEQGSSQELFDEAPSEFVHASSAFQVLWLLPQNLLIAGLKVYRALISPLYGDVCKHFPTCSAYGLESVTRHGAVRGLGLTVRRLLRCHPWAAGGIDRVPDGGRRFESVADLPRILLLNHPTPEDRARLLSSFAPTAIPGSARDAHRESPLKPRSSPGMTDAA